VASGLLRMSHGLVCGRVVGVAVEIEVTVAATEARLLKVLLKSRKHSSTPSPHEHQSNLPGARKRPSSDPASMRSLHRRSGFNWSMH
jgi:hypothetical protein